LKNPNPVFLSDRHAFTTARQVQDYLLCDECEQRFSDRGERWVLGHCYRAESDFKIREALLRSKPALHGEGVSMYAGATVPEVDVDQLTYFGLSVFWRAAVHTWQDAAGPVRIELGPYEERLRLFLLDKESFPARMTYAVRISGLKRLLQTCWLPESENHDGFHTHQFSVPGVVFGLLAGARIPADHFRFCTARSPERFISIVPELDARIISAAAEKVQKAQNRMR